MDTKNKKYTERLCCSKETKDLIVNKCKEEYLRNYPEMKNVKLSQEFILNKIGQYYIRT